MYGAFYSWFSPLAALIASCKIVHLEWESSNRSLSIGIKFKYPSGATPLLNALSSSCWILITWSSWLAICATYRDSTLSYRARKSHGGGCRINVTWAWIAQWVPRSGERLAVDRWTRLEVSQFIYDHINNDGRVRS